MDITVETLLSRKGYEIFSVAADCKVYDALRVLAENNIGAVLVFEAGKMVGIFSERDYARKVVLKGRSDRATAVREVMTENPITVDVQETIVGCMDLMTGKHIRHLPVVKDGAVSGVISIGDIVKAIITEQQSAIKHLEGFITGGR
jgi:CBS domain-containing protein